MKNINQIFKVPNTIEGQFFIEQAKKFISPCYKMRYKGRTINDKKLRKHILNNPPLSCQTLKEELSRQKRWRQNYGNYPLTLCDNIGIYIDCRDKKLGTIGAANSDYAAEYRDNYWEKKDKNTDLSHRLDRISRIMRGEE